VQCSLRSLQLDNQLVTTQQPVMLRPNPKAHARNPIFLQLSVLKLRRCMPPPWSPAPPTSRSDPHTRSA
tara:strand:- start:444 stop:650 length:207 start_codon:yes stop_codon:yes gene_type:complete